MIDFIEGFKSLSFSGMIVLGSWAALNILVSLIFLKKAENWVRYFLLMNIFWNLINLILAASGLFNTLRLAPAEVTLFSALNRHFGMQNLLSLNTGLDVGYVMTGFFLIERANRGKRPELLTGFGRSLVLQGGFLFIFDLVLFLLHRARNPLIEGLL